MIEDGQVVFYVSHFIIGLVCFLAGTALKSSQPHVARHGFAIVYVPVDIYKAIGKSIRSNHPAAIDGMVTFFLQSGVAAVDAAIQQEVLGGQKDESKDEPDKASSTDSETS